MRLTARTKHVINIFSNGLRIRVFPKVVLYFVRHITGHFIFDLIKIQIRDIDYNKLVRTLIVSNF